MKLTRTIEPTLSLCFTIFLGRIFDLFPTPLCWWRVSMPTDLKGMRCPCPPVYMVAVGPDLWPHSLRGVLTRIFILWASNLLFLLFPTLDHHLCPLLSWHTEHSSEVWSLLALTDGRGCPSFHKPAGWCQSFYPAASKSKSREELWGSGVLSAPPLANFYSLLLNMACARKLTL